MRRFYWILSILLLLPLTAGAQVTSRVAARFAEYTFANKPSAPFAGTRITVTDCATTACAAGGGTIRADLRWTGAQYEVIAAVGGVSPVAALDDLTDVTLTSPATNDVLAYSGGAWVNSISGLPSRADNDGTVTIATTDRNSVVNVGHATANAVSIAQAGVAAGNGFIGGWQTIVCTTGAGLTTITPSTSTINTYTTLTLRQGECARIFVPTEADTNYLATIDGGQYLEVNVELFGPTVSTAVGDGAAYLLVGPKMNGMTLINMFSQVYTAGTTNATSVAIARCAAAATNDVCSGTVDEMLSVNQTIDTGENSSDTAATGVTINASNAVVTAGQVIRFDVDAVSTTAAKGLQVTLRFRK